MQKPLIRDLQELVEANIITAATAQQITEYYQAKQAPSTNKFNLVLGILGAILVGSGIILLVAHNWDVLNRLTKTILAFLPLAIAQTISIYVIIRKRESRVWQEGAASFLFFTVAASIAMISQIYHIDGSLNDFLLTWLVLTIPLIYLHGSSLVSLLCIAVATWYAVDLGYHALFSSRVTHYPYWYLVLMLCIAPGYYRLAAHNNTSNFFHLHNWFLIVSLCIALGAFSRSNDSTIWIFAGYMALFGLCYILGNTVYFRDNNLWANPFRLLGIIGILFILITYSFGSIWDSTSGYSVLSSPFFYFAVVLLGTGIWFIIRNGRDDEKQYNPTTYSAYIFCLLAFFFPASGPGGAFIMNCLVVAIAVYFIRKGSLQNHLGILNFGLLIIAILAVFRFFDDRIPFIWRGVFFVIAGVGFFVANYLLLKKRKTLTQNTTV